ncbi:MAG: hypothetical protein NZ651_06965 [Candidatus Bipolaricaulota bacterium]|nr:hypothetical protein [Candidatus Bipolaricaulota bacterium]MDW8127493.1 hypothetical protein [Candidatus Bipolaricaulota bacterium]
MPTERMWMSARVTDLCPLQLMAGSDEPYCYERACAWWVEGKGCAMKALAEAFTGMASACFRDFAPGGGEGGEGI